MGDVTLESCIFHGSRCHITPDTIRELVKRYGLYMVDRELAVLWYEMFNQEIRSLSNDTCFLFCSEICV